MLPVVLVHGGLFEDISPESFWDEPGITAALRARGHTVAAPQRPARPHSWSEEGDALARAIRAHGFERALVVAGSNGCSAAIRAALQHPQLVERLMLCWPATAGDPVIDELARVIITDAAGPEVARELLTGEPVRGSTAVELSTVQVPAVLYPSMPENKVHQRKTVMALAEALPEPILIGGSPEPTDEQFGPFTDGFADLVVELAIVDPDD